MPDLPAPFDRIAKLVSAAGGPADVFAVGKVLLRSGVVFPVRPDRLLLSGLALLRYGTTFGAGVAAGAARHPDRAAVIDDSGELSWAELDRRTSAVAAGLRHEGLEERDRVAVLQRNGADLLVAVAGAAKAGLDVVLLNTSMAAPQVRASLEAEKVRHVVVDADLLELVTDEGSPSEGQPEIWVAHGATSVEAHPAFSRLWEHELPSLPPPKHESRDILLTSGTTGTPKGVSRGVDGISPLAGLLEAIPLRADGTTVIASPAFHAWGFLHLGLAALLGSTVVLRRKFDPEQVLRDVAEHRADAVIAVPVMLSRLLDLPEQTRQSHDTSSLRVAAVSGSALPGPLAQRFMDAFGDVLYNLYGSTEVAFAAVAGPADLRAAPGTAGKPPRGSLVRVVDADGQDVPKGQSGRIFVGNAMTFAGYTSGADKDRLEGLVATGDMGHIDEHGLLMVEGRDDDMIVSGGENVFPQPVEDALSHLPGVADVAVVGVPDEQFGSRFVAYVVKADGGKVTEKLVKDTVKREVSRFAVPREVHFVDELPRNATGKVVKKKLREQAGAET